MTERSMEDRMGEALRVQLCGETPPFWCDAPEDLKECWRGEARDLQLFLKRHGLKVVVSEGGDKGDE